MRLTVDSLRPKLRATAALVSPDSSRCSASSHWCGISFFGRPMLAPRARPAAIAVLMRWLCLRAP
jgi:hypothetical protein